MAIEFAVTNGSGWTACADSLAPDSPVRVSEAPDASAIPAMLRRRLNTLGRAVAAEILGQGDQASRLPIVYGSRHGDIERTVGVLSELALGEPVSPMHFSLSVHNAIPGIVSIHNDTTANITSLAALDAALVPVLLEAIGLVQEGCERVLCILADVPLPTPYRDRDAWPAAAFAASFVVNRGQGGTLERTPGAVTGPQPKSGSLPEALQFIEFLASAQQTFSTVHNGGRWTISKRAS